MMSHRAQPLLTAIFAVLALSACNRASGPAPATPVAPSVTALPASPAAPATAARTATADAAGAPMTASAIQTSVAPAAIKYEARGRRDPFAPLAAIEGSKTSTVAAARLRGVIQSGRGPVALVDTSDGVGYILKHGDTLADGRLVEISQDSVVFALAPRPGMGTNRVILKLPTE
jgi:hypothetical protein